MKMIKIEPTTDPAVTCMKIATSALHVTMNELLLDEVEDWVKSEMFKKPSEEEYCRMSFRMDGAVGPVGPEAAAAEYENMNKLMTTEGEGSGEALTAAGAARLPNKAPRGAKAYRLHRAVSSKKAQ